MFFWDIFDLQATNYKSLCRRKIHKSLCKLHQPLRVFQITYEEFVQLLYIYPIPNIKKKAVLPFPYNMLFIAFESER